MGAPIACEIIYGGTWCPRLYNVHRRCQSHTAWFAITKKTYYLSGKALPSYRIHMSNGEIANQHSPHLPWGIPNHKRTAELDRYLILPWGTVIALKVVMASREYIEYLKHVANLKGSFQSPVGCCKASLSLLKSTKQHVQHLDQVTLGDHQMRSSNNCLREQMTTQTLGQGWELIPPIKDGNWTYKYAQSTLAPIWLHLCLVTLVLGRHQIYVYIYILVVSAAQIEMKLHAV